MVPGGRPPPVGPPAGSGAYDGGMPAFLVLVFVVIPLIELWVILQVGQLLGAGWTIALLVLFSIIGAALLRHQGRRAWQAFRGALEEGRWPGDEVTQGALVIVGGTLLLTPGFFTDGVGFLLLAPFTRAGLSRLIRSRLTPAPVKLFGAASRKRTTTSESTSRGEVLDVEVLEIERDPRPEDEPGEDGEQGPSTPGSPPR
jgi:UPF0716 protein FxsA